jgi:hypothetical protein
MNKMINIQVFFEVEQKYSFMTSNVIRMIENIGTITPSMTALMLMTVSIPIKYPI